MSETKKSSFEVFEGVDDTKLMALYISMYVENLFILRAMKNKRR